MLYEFHNCVPSVVPADGSFEYTDSTGTDLHDFIIKTLKNPRFAHFMPLGYIVLSFTLGSISSGLTAADFKVDYMQSSACKWTCFSVLN